MGTEAGARLRGEKREGVCPGGGRGRCPQGSRGGLPKTKAGEVLKGELNQNRNARLSKSRSRGGEAQPLRGDGVRVDAGGWARPPGITRGLGLSPRRGRCGCRRGRQQQKAGRGRCRQQRGRGSPIPLRETPGAWAGTRSPARPPVPFPFSVGHAGRCLGSSHSAVSPSADHGPRVPEKAQAQRGGTRWRGVGLDKIGQGCRSAIRVTGPAVRMRPWLTAVTGGEGSAVVTRSDAVPGGRELGLGAVVAPAARGRWWATGGGGA